MGRREEVPGHVFISYVREDGREIASLQEALEMGGFRVWRDTRDLWPGEDWRARIRTAITEEALVFLACFSRASIARDRSYQNDELTLAIDELRRRPPERPWLIPVRLDNCEIPDREIGAGRTLRSIQRADLFGLESDTAAQRLMVTIGRLLTESSPRAPGPAGGPAPEHATGWLAGSPAFPPRLGDGIGDHEVLAAYLRWATAVHARAEIAVAGHPVTAPMDEAPWVSLAVANGPGSYGNRREIEHLRTARPGPAGEVAGLAERPLPTSLTPAGPVDLLDLTGHTTRDARALPDSAWRCLVLGDPGSGKTTLIRRFARAQVALAPQEARDDRVWRLPVLCRAADLVEFVSDMADASWHALAGYAIMAGWQGVPADPLSGDEIPPDALARLAGRAAEAGRLLLMVDGLDEVPTRQQRARLVAALNAMIDGDRPRLGLPAQAAGNQLIITSRLVGYYATPLSARVEHLILLPVDMPTAIEIGRYWLKHYALKTKQNPARVQRIEQRFRRAVADGGAVTREVWANPFLLTSLISAVASDRVDQDQLRGRGIVRGDLYEFMADDALARAMSRFPGLPAEFLLGLHEAMAYNMHSSSRTGVFDIPALRSCAHDALDALASAVECSPEIAMAVQLNGFGLLTERGQDLYGFRHLSLEEYYAGRYLAAADNGADRMRSHFGDPRWVEPICFGLGYLARHDPERLGGLLDDLLAGPSGQHAAQILARIVEDLAEALSPGHIEAAVAALLAAEVAQIDASDQASATADALAPMLTSRGTLPTGDKSAEIISRALTTALGAQAQWTVTAAARAIEALPLLSRESAEALFRAQERDSEEYGWATVRALSYLVTAAAGAIPATEPGAVSRVWSGFREEERAALRSVAVQTLPKEPDGAEPRFFIPRSLTPFRNALDAAAIEIMASRPYLTRLVYCLYGGFPFSNTRRWAREQARTQSELNAVDVEPTIRHSAAIRLDTVIASAVRREEQDSQLRTEYITADSPLTAYVLDWITAARPASFIADRLCEIVHQRSVDSVTRGDALAAWCVLGGDEIPSPVRSYEVLDEYARRRFAWRMGRAAFLLGDSAARFSPGAVVSTFEGQELSPESISHLAQMATRALTAVTGDAPRGGGWGEPFVTPQIQELLVAAVCGTSDDKAYSTAVILDTAARWIIRSYRGIPHLLATAHLVAAGYGLHSADWRLDPYAPCTEPPLPESLTALAGLSATFGFLQCWMLDRMDSALVISGLAVEAMCLALEVRRYDPVSADRTISRFVKLIPGLEADHQRPAAEPALLAALDETAARIADPYAAARARLYLASARGYQLEHAGLAAMAESIASPVSRLRLLELAMTLGVAAREAELRALMADCAARVTDGLERTLADARLAAIGVIPAPAHGFRDNLMRHVSRVRTLTGGLGPESAIGDAPLADGLLRRESITGPQWKAGPAWTVLTGAALCADALTALPSAQPGTVVEELLLWQRVTDPGERAAAVTGLRRLGLQRMLELDVAKCASITALLAADDEDSVVAILTVSRAPRYLAEIDAWRTQAKQRAADLATLLVIESGRLDVGGVTALPRLLASGSDLIRLRTGLSTATVSRGAGGRPRFAASHVGPDTLAELVRLTRECERNAVRLSGDLWWALSDIVIDSHDVLRNAMSLLADDPDAGRLLMTSIRQLTPEALGRLAAVSVELPELEQLALLHSLQQIAQAPERGGLQPDVLADLPRQLAGLDRDSSDAVQAELHYLLGLVLPATGPSLSRLIRTASAGSAADLAGVRTRATGAIYGAGLLLARLTATDHDEDQTIAEAISGLRALARGTDERLATAAVAALGHAGDTEYLRGLLREGRLDAVTLLWGTIESQPVLINDRFRGDARRIAEFIYWPPVPYDADAARYTANMTQALLRRAGTLMDKEMLASHGDRSLLRVSWNLGNLLSVLTELARLQPAGLRGAVADGHPEFRARLVHAASGAPDWVVREYAPRLLVFLGQGDASTVGAILDTALDTDVIRQHALAELDWFESIQDDGFALLLDTLVGPRLSQCYIAVRMLSSLLRHRALDAHRHAEALQAIQGTLDRADADELLLAERQGQVMTIGSYKDACRRYLARLATGGDRAARMPADAQFMLSLPDVSGNNADFVAPADGAELPGQSALSYQLTYYREVEGRQFPVETTNAIAMAGQAARSAGVSLAALLAKAGQAPDETGS